jgi:hypothetical protein
LRREKAHEQSEKQAHRRQKPWRDSLERLGAVVLREPHDDDEDHGRDEVRGGQDHDGKPSGRQVVQPAHPYDAGPKNGARLPLRNGSGSIARSPEKG